MCSPGRQGTAARIMSRVLLNNASPTASGLRTAHERLRGAVALSVALKLADAEAELQWIADHLADCREHADVHEWSRSEIKRAIARLIERIQ